MDILVQAIIEGAIKLGEYLASLPEQDRQKAIDQLRATQVQTAQDVSALRDELAAVKAAHAALKAQQTP